MDILYVVDLENSDLGEHVAREKQEKNRAIILVKESAFEKLKGRATRKRFAGTKELLAMLVPGKKNTVDISFCSRELALTVLGHCWVNGIACKHGTEEFPILQLGYSRIIPHNCLEVLEGFRGLKANEIGTEKLGKETGFGKSVMQELVKQMIRLGLAEEKEGNLILSIKARKIINLE